MTVFRGSGMGSPRRRGMKTNKRLVVFQVALLLACAGLGARLVAAGSVSVALTSVSGYRGDNVTIQVSINPAPGTQVSAMQFDISFHTSAVSLLQAQIGPAADAAGKSLLFNTNNNRFIISGLNSNAISAGVVALLQFRISVGASAGTYPVTCSNLVVSDPASGAVSVAQVTSGAVTVLGSVPTTLPTTTSTSSSLRTTTTSSTSTSLRATTTTTSPQASTTTIPSGVPSQAIRISSCGSTAGGLAEIEISLLTARPVSALQMDFSYPSAVTSFVSAVAGPAAQNAGKTLSASTISGNTQRLVLTGLNQNPIATGVIAVLQLRNLAAISLGRHPLQASNLVASSPEGTIYRDAVAYAGFLEVVPAPNLEDLSPASGSPGMLVTLSGSNLGGCRRISKVVFRGAGGYLRNVIPLESGPQQVVAAVPTDATGTLGVSLRLDQQASNELSFPVDPQIPFAMTAAQSSPPASISAALTPGDAAISPRFNRVYIVDTLRNKLAVMDALSGRILGEAAAESGAARVAVNHTSGDILVSNRTAGTVSVFQDTAAGNPAGRTVLRVGRGPLGIAVDERNNIAVVANSDDNTVSLISMITRLPVPLPVGSKPTAVAVDSIRHRAFVLNERDASVSQVDLTLLRVEKTFSGFGQLPQAIAYHMESGILLVGGPSGLYFRWPDTGKSAQSPEGLAVEQILLHPGRWLAEVFSPGTRAVTTWNLALAGESLSAARLGRSVLREGTVSGAALNPLTNQALFLHPLLTSASSASPAAEAAAQTSGFSRLTLPVSLYFPRLLFRLQDYMGLAFSNPSQECCQTAASTDTGDSAALQITAMAAGGSKLSTAGITNPQTQTLPWRGQLARLDYELFGNSMVSASDAWIFAGASSPSVRTIFLTGDFSTSMVGAEENGSLSKELILPAARSGEQTLVGIINPSPFSFMVTVELMENSGQVRQSLDRPIAGYGFVRLSVREDFSSAADWKDGGYLRVRGSGPIRAYEQFVPDGRTDPAGLNGISTGSGSGDLAFAHFAVGQGYDTRIGIVNLDSQAFTATVTARSASGQIMGIPRTVPLAAAGRAEFGLDALDVSGQGVSQGWIRISGSGRMTGYVTYSTGGAMAAVASLPEPRAQLIFSHLAESGTGFFTGLALANTNSEPVGVRLYVFRKDGTLIAATSSPIQVPALGRVIGLLNQLVGPEVIGQAGGYIRVMADLPIHGIEIFGTDDGRAFANIPAQ